MVIKNIEEIDLLLQSVNFGNNYYFNSSGRHDRPFHLLRNTETNAKVNN